MFGPMTISSGAMIYLVSGFASSIPASKATLSNTAPAVGVVHKHVLVIITGSLAADGIAAAATAGDEKIFIVDQPLSAGSGSRSLLRGGSARRRTRGRARRQARRRLPHDDADGAEAAKLLGGAAAG